MRHFLLLIFSFFLILSGFWVQATHIRAGEIIVRRTSNITLSFEITVIGYTDEDSQIRFGGGVLRLGDDNVVNGPFDTSEEQLDANTKKVWFTVNHTYSRPNAAGYLINYQEDFRNDNIININNGNSVQTTFYTETLIIIDPFYGINNSPVLTVPPVDFAAIGSRFVHNPGAFDPDGDSLAYKITDVKRAQNTIVGGYRELINDDFYTNFAQGNESMTGIPTLTLDTKYGDLIWDAPGDVTNQEDPPDCEKKAEYNIAFIIEEWRTIFGRPRLMGYVERDMQIIVCASDNERPIIDAPDPVCVEAGTNINEIIVGYDPDGQPVKLEAYGGPFEVNSPATYAPFPATFQNSPGSMVFDWNTVCGHVRERPYEVQLKITDQPATGPSLVEFATWEITVVGPPPTGLTTTPQAASSMQLNWDSYSCTNADSMQIWRRVGTYDIMVDDCQLGMPPNTGYELIATVPINQTSFLDNGNGMGLSAGSNYCYRLVAEFPTAGEGKSESYISAETCDSLLIDVPVITNVDIQQTSQTNGEILVKWTPPYQIDAGTNPPPYTYDLLRGVGMDGSTAYTKVNTSPTSDTLLVDTGLNTFNQSYNYQVVLYSNGNLVDTSAMASSVRLDLTPLLQAIDLSWGATVPWSLQDPNYRYHYIYRDNVDSFDPSTMILIDSVEVIDSPLKYTDNGAFNNEPLDENTEYCYLVTTYGSYGNDLLPEPLINKSQITCAQPNDTISPCRPPAVAFTDNFNCADFLQQECGANVFENRIEWNVDQDPTCDMDIQFYNIWFTSTGNPDDYEIVGTSLTNVFLHDDLPSFKGCYRIQAVDRSGNTSEFTEEICRDNCPIFKLPNAFSPNNDGVNDTFTPYYNNEFIAIESFDNSNCTRFVKHLIFKVFDRSGKELFTYNSSDNENNILINWDGSSNTGMEVPAGVYYYSAEVEFDVLEQNQPSEVFSGWVQILR
ncbi:MAG: gliding motility-associated C-terminal domain-containing protein [Bacteroidota bacterium]